MSLRFAVLHGDESMIVRDVFKLLLTPLAPTFAPFKKDNGSWVMDPHNDIFLRYVGGPNDNEYELSHRYEFDDGLKAVGVILEWRGPYKVIDGANPKGEAR